MLTIEITTNLPEEKAKKLIKEVMEKFEAQEKSDSIKKWFDNFVKWLKKEKVETKEEVKVEKEEDELIETLENKLVELKNILNKLTNK